MSERDDNPLADLGDDLLGELEQWDEMFDSLHESGPPDPGGAAGASGAAAGEAAAASAGEAAAAAATEAAGAAAAGAAPMTARGERVTAPPSAPAPEPPDLLDEQEPFPLRGGDMDLDGEPRALGALLGTRPRRASSLSSDDDGLYTSAARPALDPPTSRQRTARTVRRGPAIIRRDRPPTEVTRPRSPLPDALAPVSGELDDDGVDDFGREERTSVVASEVVGRLAESAEALFRDAPPEVALELDEDFYDDIEVAAQADPEPAGPSAAEDGPMPSPLPSPLPGRLPGGEPTARRTTRHLVRRERRRVGETAPAPIAGLPAEHDHEHDHEPAGQGGAVAEKPAGELDLDAAFSDLAFDVDEDSGGAAADDHDAVPRPIEPAAVSEPMFEPDLVGDADLPPSAPDLSALSAAEIPAARGPAVEAPAGDLDLNVEVDEGSSEPAIDVAFDDGGHDAPAAEAPVLSAEDREVEDAFDHAVAMSDGTLTAQPVADVDVAPDLPASRFPAAEPPLDLDAIQIADAEPSATDRTEELARDLLLYERELTLMDEPGPTARLRLEAGRLAEQLGDLDRARAHYDGALQLDPRLRPPLRALRRVERALGNFQEAVRHLDAEIELSSDMERRALQAYRADLLMAIGEQDLARVAVGELLDGGPTDVRALLAHLELAWVDGRHAEVDASLERLAQAVADQPLAGAMQRIRGLLTADGDAPLRAALMTDPGDRLAWLALASRAAARGEDRAVAEALVGLTGDGGLAELAPELAGAFEARRAEVLARSGAPAEEIAAALDRGAALLPGDAALREATAALRASRGELLAAAGELLAVAAAAPGGPRAARACRQSARLHTEAGDRPGAVDALRLALDHDRSDALAQAQLVEVLEEAGDEASLVDLDRRLAGDDPDEVHVRVRLARRLERAGRADEAIAILSRSREAGMRSAALDAELGRLYQASGRLADRAALTARQLEERASYVDPAAAARRTAAALERLASAAPAAAPPGPALTPVADALGGASWDDRSATGLLDGVPGPAQVGLAGPAAGRIDGAGAPSLLDGAPPEADDADADAVPEPVFGPPSARLEDASGPAEGIWREAAARSGAVPGAPAERPRERAELEEAAMREWRRAIELEPDSMPARAGLLRLCDRRGRDEERLEVLAEVQRGAVQPAWAISIAVRRAELLVAEHDRDGAEKVLRAGAALDPDDPRCFLALLRLLCEDLRWEEAAELLAERADALGDGDHAIALRYRAAALLLDRTEEVARAVELLTPVVTARPDFHIAADLMRAAQRRLGDAAPAVDPSTAVAATARPGDEDGFVRLVREAELVELQVGDPGRAAELYGQAMALRPDDPLARDGFARAAGRAGETAPLAELALADLRRAEAMADGAAKATAYEELARIDAELRGDLASAILAWESAAESDPGRMSALRSLERAYLAGGTERERELLQVVRRILSAVDGHRDRVALTGEEARLSERTRHARDEVLAVFRRQLELEPTCRMALFRLEAAARQDGPSRELAELERQVARAFAGDARAEAAFLTRAGETLQAIGDGEAAIASFRAAAAALPGYPPALAGWRDVAIAGEMWLDVAEAAEREAESASTDGERARLYHLAGVALMDRALAGERAIGALRRVLDIDPAHGDAFQRLKQLYEEMGRDLELVELYRQRLDVERDPAMQVRLHQGLATLYRNFFDDREAARSHLKDALAIEPGNLRVVADLSDIAWELGDWAEAAEMLMARAKLETRPQLLRTIFFRLGVIYADRLPDPRFAMMAFQKVLGYDPHDLGALERVADLAFEAGDHRLALGACEQLIKQTAADPDKVPHLHRVARIYQEGFKDRTKAERAYRIALDLDPTSDAALVGLVEFYRDAGDARSARVHLDRVAGAMRQRLAADPSQLRPYQVLARALEAREGAGVPGSLATAQAAAEIAVLLGSQEPRDLELAAAASRARPPLAGLGGAEIDDLLFPAPAGSSLRALFRMLGDRLAKHVGTDVRRWGVGRAERLRKGSDPLAGMILEMAGEMGVEDVDVYLSPRQPTLLAVEPTSPVSLVLGPQLATLDRPAELRFLVARSLKLALSALAVPARLPPDELGVLLAGILRQFSPEFSPPGLDPQLVAAEQQKLRRLIPSQLVQELAPFALGIAGAEFDHRAIWTAIVEGGNRAGLLAAGSVGAALGSVLRMGGYRDIHQGVRDPLVAGLLRFAVGEDHVALRAQLGG